MSDLDSEREKPGLQRELPFPALTTQLKSSEPSHKRRVVRAALAGLLVSTVLLAGFAFWPRPDLVAPDLQTATDSVPSETGTGAVVAAPVTVWEDGWRVTMRPRLPSLTDVSPVVLGTYTDTEASFLWTDAANKIIAVQNPYLPSGTTRTGWFDLDPGTEHVFRLSFIPSPERLRQVCSLRFAVDGQEIMKADGIKLDQGIAEEVRLLSPKLRSDEPVASRLDLWSSCIKVTDDAAADPSEMDNMLGSRERLTGTASPADPEKTLGAGIRIEVSRDGGEYTPVNGSEVRWERTKTESKEVTGSPSFSVIEMAYGTDWTDVIDGSAAEERVIRSNRLQYGFASDAPVTPIRLRSTITTDETGPHVIAMALGRENQHTSIVSCHVAGRLDGEPLARGVVSTGHKGHGIWLHQVALEAGRHDLEIDFSCKPRGHRSLMLQADATPSVDGVELVLMAKRPSEERLLPREDGFFAIEASTVETPTTEVSDTEEATTEGEEK